LIANRGEIARRIIRSCHALGIEAVAVHSDADAGAAFVAEADHVVAIGGPAPRDSYLVIDRIIDAARATGAEAIHPGYGFLSENPALADACAAAGMVLIGPAANTIRAMAAKDGAKAIAAAAGVPVLPGGNGDDAALATAAAAVGWPVLVKAVGGGGGRGMRIVRDADGLPPALEAARREATNSFGDDRLLLERYVEAPRHIEVQLLADTHGNVVHLFERDCSIQRRHQKVVEEAPGVDIPDAVRAVLRDASLRLARAIGYVGAGTVEFIADAAGGLDPARVWFMEMNTRLQVEHPVTELIAGIDIVEWQIRVAAGQALPWRQDELAIDGHAIEVRLCAENPRRNYLPSPGQLALVDLPESEGVRIDTGVRSGDAVTPFYDSLLAKVIAHGPTRAAALDRLAAALGRCRIDGVATNLELLERIVDDPAFRAGAVTTRFLEDNLADLLRADPRAA